MPTTGTILTVLSNIPWGKVVENAPKLADGAARLWGAATKRGDGEADTPATPAPAPTAAEAPPPSATDRLGAQVAALEARVNTLQSRLQASTELVQTLAGHNAELVQRLETQRQGLRRLTVAGAVAAGVLLLGLLGLAVWLGQR